MSEVRVEIRGSLYRALEKTSKKLNLTTQQFIDRIMSVNPELWLQIMETSEITGIPFPTLATEALSNYIEACCSSYVEEVTEKTATA